MTALTFEFEPVEDLPLKGIGLNVERRCDRVIGRRRRSGRGVALGVEVLEVHVGPVGGERAIKRRDEFGVQALRGTHVPLEAGDLSGEGEVR